MLQAISCTQYQIRPLLLHFALMRVSGVEQQLHTCKGCMLQSDAAV